MSVPINKATPRAILLGTRDDSTGLLPLETEQLPQHLPLTFLMTETGEDMSIASGSALTALYGEKTFDPNSAFFNHQTVLAETVLARGNQVMVKPIKLPGSTRASIRLSVEPVATTITSSTGVKKNVTRLIYHVDTISASLTGSGFGMGKILASYRSGKQAQAIDGAPLSKLIKEDGTEYAATSSLIPLIDAEVDFRGSKGNCYGFSIDAPIATDSYPTDQSLSATLKSYIYRLKMYQKPETSSSAKVIYNSTSSDSTDFVLKPHSSDPNSGRAVSLQDVIVESYESEAVDGYIGTRAPFANVHIYNDNIEAVTRLVAGGYDVQGEDQGGATATFSIPGLYNTEEQVRENLYKVNIITGVDYNGDAYPNVDFDNSVKFGGVRLGRDSIVYAQGGSDGIPFKNGAIDRLETLRLFDEAVRSWCQNEFVETNPVFDSAKFPFTTLWDSGFSMKTKLSMLLPMGQHKRIWTALATHSVADYLDPNAVEPKFIYQEQLSGTDEISRASSLRIAAAIYPESEVYGTPVVRAIIVGRSGVLRSKRVRNYLPLTISVADKVAAYCGAGNGVWNSDNAFDQGDNKREKMFTNVNQTYQSRAAYNKSWDAGMIWVQQFDRGSLFFPAYQTAYPDDTSVLNSLSLLIAVSYLERVCEEVWRVLTGDNKLSGQAFIDASNELIIERTRGRFDNRFTIVPNTYFTEADSARGYSWTTDISIYAENSHTVGTFSIVAKRASELVAG